MDDYKAKAEGLGRQVGWQQRKIRELIVHKEDADRRLDILKQVKHLLTSTQENWREQVLFDAYDLIEEELGRAAVAATGESAP